jgi:2-polyprenyl-3-methyl-5-hydroxy-6-metoxy-1,4-benzoquinol methylase
MRLIHNIKLAIANRFGYLIYPLISNKYKEKIYSNLLSIEFDTNDIIIKPTIINLIIINKFKSNYNPDLPNEYFRKLIKKYVWGGTLGKKWHEKESSDDPSLNKYMRWRKSQVEQIKSFLSQNNEYKYIVEVGCGNGLYIKYLSQELGTKYKYAGIDLSMEQIKINVNKYKDNSDISFYYGSADEIEVFNSISGVLYVTFGTLTCFTQKELSHWLNIINNSKKKKAISLSEWIVDYDVLKENESKSMSPTLYNHNYEFLLKEQGYNIIHKLYDNSREQYSNYTRTVIIGETSINDDVEKNEKRKLDRIADKIDTHQDFDGVQAYYTGKLIAPFIRGLNTLECGCSTGVMTEILIDSAKSLDVIEGSETYAKIAQTRLGNRLNIKVTLFEDFVPEKLYEAIVFAGVLHHMEDPIFILNKLQEWLLPGGKIYISVPNMTAFHRRLGLSMGIIKSVYDASERNIFSSQPGRYDMNTLLKTCEQANLDVMHSEAFFLKPFPHEIMNNIQLDEKVLDGLFEMGRQMPEYASLLFVVAQKSTNAK